MRFFVIRKAITWKIVKQKKKGSKNMEHHFNVELAKEYGILEAVLLNNLQFWIEKNRANGTNFCDGHYWTYNSAKAFSELFPYASQKQIRKALQNLIGEGIIQTGNFNRNPYDRTLWYSFTEKGKRIFQKVNIDLPKRENGNALEGQPIPNNKTNNKTNNKLKESKKERKPKKQTKSYDEQITEYTQNEDLQNALKAFLQMRSFVKKPMTEYALKLMLKKLDELGNTDDVKIAILNQSITHNWQGIFPLKDEYTKQEKQPEKKYDQNGYESEEDLMAMFYGK